jgi:hypothetical protein
VRTRPWATAGIALVASLALATAGCGNSGNNDDGAGGTTSSPTAAVAADPKQALADSVKGIAEGNFTFTISDYESTGQGSVHSPSKSGQATMKSKPSSEVDMTLGFVILKQDRWVKFTINDPELAKAVKLPKTWQHIDPAKIKDKDALKDLSIDFDDPNSIDPAGAPLIVKAIVDAEQTGEGAYKGTVDLTKAKDAGMVDTEVIGKLGAKAKAVPFTATLDDQGRLTKLVINVPAAGDVKAHKLEATYADYGGASAAKKPSGAIEASSMVYEIINS